MLWSLLVATLPFGGVLADSPKGKDAKETVVYQHELPNVPGKSIKGVLVEYGPGGYSPGHTHPHPPSSTRPCSRGRSAARSTTDR
jgi:quercetin dioxygenase-like cupin family protein